MDSLHYWKYRILCIVAYQFVVCKVCKSTKNSLSLLFPLKFRVNYVTRIFFFPAECGDFVIEDYPDHTYLSTFKFVPQQDGQLERRIMENHKKHV